MKVLFLDIDGVMCVDGVNIDSGRLLLLKRIVDHTDASIVLSSEWRKDASGLTEVAKALSKVGLQLYDITPNFGDVTDGVRPLEVLDWLDNSANITGWVVIDDFNLLEEQMGDALKDNFVRTNEKHGLQESDATQAIEKLNAFG